MGGAVSGEHGIGLEKKSYLADHGDPVMLSVMKRIKNTFDPHAILNPGKLIDPE
jgi:glycolate oxidase